MSKEKKVNSITYAPNSPLVAETLKPPHKEMIKHHNYGVRKLRQRCHTTKAKINSRH